MRSTGRPPPSLITAWARGSDGATGVRKGAAPGRGSGGAEAWRVRAIAGVRSIAPVIVRRGLACPDRFGRVEPPFGCSFVGESLARVRVRVTTGRGAASVGPGAVGNAPGEDRTPALLGSGAAGAVAGSGAAVGSPAGAGAAGATVTPGAAVGTGGACAAAGSVGDAPEGSAVGCETGGAGEGACAGGCEAAGGAGAAAGGGATAGGCPG
jgi:hypothetical protein